MGLICRWISPGKASLSRRKICPNRIEEITIMAIHRMLGLILLLGISAPLWSQEVATEPPPWKSRYPVIKAWHEELLNSTPCPAQRLDGLRQLIRSGSGGERLLNSMFKNFEGEYSIDPTIPGVEEAARLSSSSNPNVAKGYRRALRYAQIIDNDKRFVLNRMEGERPCFLAGLMRHVAGSNS